MSLTFMKHRSSKYDFINLLRPYMWSCLFIFSLSASQANAFTCSIFEGTSKDIPSFTNEIAELKNMDKRGRQIKVIVPREGPVQEFDLDAYLEGAEDRKQIQTMLDRIAGGSTIYIDLYPIEARYEIRMGRLTSNLNRVIDPTVYANFAYNLERNEVYDLQSKLAVFCN